MRSPEDGKAEGLPLCPVPPSLKDSHGPKEGGVPKPAQASLKVTVTFPAPLPTETSRCQLA